MSKEKDKQRRVKQAKYEKERASVEDFRRTAPRVKAALRQVGCDLPFYDYLDSYADEFARIVAEAKRDLPSLLDVHELDEKEYWDTDWTKLGYGNLEQIFFSIDDQFSEYGTNNKRKANLKGSASYFLDGQGGFKSVVLIAKNPQSSVQHRDLKYSFKIATLLHELGHIHDAEKAVNVDPLSLRFDVVEAEVYSNCFALERLADRCQFYTYSSVYEAMQTLAASRSYEAEIGRLVLERHPKRQVPKWQDYIEEAKAVSGVG